MFKKIIGGLLFPLGSFIAIFGIVGLILSISSEEVTGITLAENILGILLLFAIAFGCIRTALVWTEMIPQNFTVHQRVKKVLGIIAFIVGLSFCIMIISACYSITSRTGMSREFPLKLSVVITIVSFLLIWSYGFLFYYAGRKLLLNRKEAPNDVSLRMKRMKRAVAIILLILGVLFSFAGIDMVLRLYNDISFDRGEYLTLLVVVIFIFNSFFIGIRWMRTKPTKPNIEDIGKA